jgi:regulator of RNase E activity RraA
MTALTRHFTTIYVDCSQTPNATNIPVSSLNSPIRVHTPVARRCEPARHLRWAEVHPGDYIIADDAGVIAIPARHFADALEIAKEFGAYDRRFEAAPGFGRRL